jgi:hypothetical protein
MTWETDFRRFEKRTWIISRAERITREFCFWIRIGIGLEFFSSSGMLAQSSAWSVYLLFPSLLLLFFFSLVSSVLSLHLARCHACMDAQVGSAFQVPSHFVCSLLCSSSSKGTGSQDRFSIRSDQINPPINQRKNKSKQHSSAVLCVSTE